MTSLHIEALQRSNRRRLSLGAIGMLLVASGCTAGSETTLQPEPATTGSTATTARPVATTAATTTQAVVTTIATTSTTTTTTQPPRIWDSLERVSFMLLGSDAGVGRIGTRTDTVMLLSIEPTSGDAVLLAIPRNLTEAPLPEGMGVWSCNCFPDIITHLWANGEWYPDAFPGPQSPSVNALKGALGLIFDQEIHYYAKVDLVGFVAMIDAIGGVTIDVPKRIVDETYPHENGETESIVIEEGTQHLDGHQALAYGRIRRNSGDFARMHRQRCLLGAIVRDTDIADIMAGSRELATTIADHVETDIPMEHIGDFVVLLSRLSIDRLATLRITSHKYGESGHAGYQIYDLAQIRADATALMEDPTTQLASQDGNGLEATCELSFD